MNYSLETFNYSDPHTHSISKTKSSVVLLLFSKQSIVLASHKLIFTHPFVDTCMHHILPFHSKETTASFNRFHFLPNPLLVAGDDTVASQFNT